MISPETDGKQIKMVLLFFFILLQMLENNLAQISLTVLTALWTAHMFKERLWDVFGSAPLHSVVSGSDHCPQRVKETRKPNKQTKQKPRRASRLICSVFLVKRRAGAPWNVLPATSPHCVIHQGVLAFISTLCWLTPLIYGHREMNEIQQHHWLLG